ncbi:hypothetical protein FKP32DRAFT_1589263 [Trametes sanguinea]|nr:hypothetical protein FKP32DRAFT_1589263 [Trametes sanguinea]
MRVTLVHLIVASPVSACSLRLVRPFTAVVCQVLEASSAGSITMLSYLMLSSPHSARIDHTRLCDSTNAFPDRNCGTS